MTNEEFAEIELRVTNLIEAAPKPNLIIRDFKKVVDDHRHALLKLEKIQRWVDAFDAGSATEEHVGHQVRAIMKGII